MGGQLAGVISPPWVQELKDFPGERASTRSIGGGILQTTEACGEQGVLRGVVAGRVVPRIIVDKAAGRNAVHSTSAPDANRTERTSKFE